MPLLPDKIDNLASEDKALLRKVIQNSSFVLSEYQFKNKEMKQIS